MKHLRIVLQILVSLGLLAFLFSRVDLTELKSRLGDLSLAWIAFIFVLYSADRLLMTYKWRLLLEAKGLHAPFWELAKLYYASTFIGMFLPVTVGADVIRGYKLFKDGHHGVDVATSIVVERLLGFLAAAIAAFVCCAVLVFGMGHDVLPVFWITAALLAAVGLGFVAPLNFPFFRRLAKHHDWILRKMEKLYGPYSAYRDHVPLLVVFTLLSVVAQMGPVIANWAAARALQIDIPFWVFLLVMPVTQLIAKLPISVSGFGVTQGMVALLLGRMNYSVTHAVIISLLADLTGTIAALPGMFFEIRTKREESGVME
jgi:glycosyltransferase 2 family protein